MFPSIPTRPATSRNGSANASARLAGTLALFTVLLVSATAQASPLDLFGFGARGGAMAGVVAASPEGHEAVYYNPAGLAFQTQPSFAVGFQAAHYFMKVNGDSRDIGDAPATIIGTSIPLPFGGFLKHRLAIGMGFILPTTSLLTAGIPRPAQERFVIVENRAQAVSIQFGLGVRIFDWLSVGFGALALAELIGAVDVAPNETGRIGAQVRDELVADYAFNGGFIIKPLEWLSISAMFRDKSQARFDLPIDVSLGDGFPLPIPLLDVTGVAQYDPMQVSLDVTGTFGQTVVGVGSTWKRWSAFVNPIVYTAVPDEYPEQPLPDFQDIFLIRAGAESRFDLGGAWWLTPRGGFTWEPSPVPEQVGLHNYLDSDRFIFAAGVSAGWAMIRLDVGVQYHFMPEQTETKDGQLIMDQTLAMPEENPGYPEIVHGGGLVFWATEVGFSF